MKKKSIWLYREVKGNRISMGSPEMKSNKDILYETELYVMSLEELDHRPVPRLKN